jgi:FkbM family methyltransferase
MAFGLRGAVQALTRSRWAAPPQGELLVLTVAGTPLSLRSGSSDIETFEKIFVWREYAFSSDQPVKTIIDCGSNVGLSPVWFAMQHPSARIIALEPNAGNFHLLKSNTQRFPNIHALEAAVWNRSCLLELENPGAHPDSFRFSESRGEGPHRVRAFDLETLAQEHGIERINILKIDIEGAEEALFSADYAAWLSRVDLLIVEIHGKNAREAIESALPGVDWKRMTLGENDIFIRIAKPGNSVRP